MNVAIVGATGLVGRMFIKVLEERNFPVDELFLFASSRSKGKLVKFKNKEVEIIELTKESFKDRGIQIALFSAGGEISREYAPLFANEDIIVIDNSSAFRMDPDVPLVVPEVNPEDIKKNKGIIANPNCSTIQAVVALGPLDQKYRIKRIVFSTYQAVSGAGMAGIQDLENGDPLIKFPYPIKNNCLPHIDSFLDNGYTKEEMKMVNETRKILGRDDLKITATTVRVPVLNSHSESINIEFENKIELEVCKDVLKNAKGVVLYDDVKNNIYPLATVANDKDEVFVGRVRLDESVDNGLNLFVVADNVRKGAATNAVQIAEELLNQGGIL